ncbi:MAG: class I SAM-dependent methyltransferase [Deltaproteobacteria bacterium]|nr:class I SAM-dependent methyltransferase [Deltaproteobacteria bacterium]
MKEGDVTGRDYFSEWSKLYDVARFSQEIKRIKKFKQGGKVLDIGCATGSFMKMVHLEGFEPYGVDVSSFAVDYIKNTYGFPAFVGFLAESNFDKGMFDIVTMHHVIEHIPNPVKFLLNEVKPILKDNGLLVAEVPNFGSFESKINREEWEDLKPWEHLNQFTPETLRLCLEKAGFRVIKTATYSPQTHRLLWRYPQLLSFIGLPESVIKQIAHLIRLYLKDKDSKDKAEGSSEGLRDRTLLDDITRFLVMPLDFLYSNLRIGKYLAIYAEPV